MLKVLRACFFLTLLASPSLAQVNTDCGTERWPVKILADPDTAWVNSELVYETSVKEQTELPLVNPHDDDPRLPEERSLVSMEVMLKAFKLEDDGDIHMVIKDLVTDSMMVAEIPNPDCPSVVQTGRSDQYRLARANLVKFTGQTPIKSAFRETDTKIQIRGVTFHDQRHGQRGMAANQREIHPVLMMNGTVGVEADELRGRIAINPNPGKDFVRISAQLTGAESITEMVITDTQGKTLSTTTFDIGRYSIDVESPRLPPGVYFVQVRTTSGYIGKKFVIQ